MEDRQAAKKVVLDWFYALENTDINNRTTSLEKLTSCDYQFRGVHPFNELSTVSAVVDTVWNPLTEAFTALQRRQDIFMAGPNLVANDMWVTSMGKFLGLFD